MFGSFGDRLVTAAIQRLAELARCTGRGASGEATHVINLIVYGWMARAYAPGVVPTMRRKCRFNWL